MIQNGATSTVTLPVETWHQDASGNPGSCVGVQYSNSVAIHNQELISPSIAVPTGAYNLSFDFFTSIYWHALALGGSYDNADITVHISTNDGTTWSTPVWQEDSLALLQASFSHNWQTYVWKRAFVNISSYGGQTIKVKFLYKGQDAAQFKLDNFAVESIPDYDVTTLNFFLNAVDADYVGYDYFSVPVSQTSFPGQTVSANVLNIGSNGAYVTLVGTGGSFTNTSAVSTIAAGGTDSLSLTANYPIGAAVNTYNLSVTTEIAGQTDENTANNTANFIFNRTQHVFARDNGVVASSINNVSSNVNQALFIGNVFDIYDDMEVYGIQIRLANQATSVGQQIDARIELYNSTGQTFEFLAETDGHEILEGDVNNWVTLMIIDGPVTLTAGSSILLMAHHYGGAEEVSFASAQKTTYGSVLGRTANGNLFNLLEPNAIMIRLTEDPTLSAKAGAKLAGVDVYPNPSTGVINVSNDKNVESTVVVTDLTGKVVTSKVSSAATFFDLSNNGAGVYFVTVSNATGSMVQKVVIK